MTSEIPLLPEPTTSSRQLGPMFHDDGSVTFRVWAPLCAALQVRIVGNSVDTVIAMNRDETGLFTARALAGYGMDYWIELADGTRRADPTSRYQPQGVHGPSRLVDTSKFKWSCNTWQGVPKRSLILYEMHLGTFTRDGTYTAAIERLDHLVGLGVTAIELMPIAETAGKRNWGYDGVQFFAPRSSYGTPAELCAFIDAAHARGLAVILDVVYNHFGPEGNYLHDFGGYVSTKHRTVWGDSPNLDEANARPMRDTIVANARYWIEEYRFDGLRLDAIHCIADDSPVHIVTEIGRTILKCSPR
jgi:maltooligosyltrehalose trehalohydrolase